MGMWVWICKQERIICSYDGIGKALRRCQ